MKRLSIILVAIVSIAISCKKDSVSKKGNATLPGTWGLRESYYSIGGPQIKGTVAPGQYVKFSVNGDFESNSYAGYNHYTLSDSVTMFINNTGGDQLRFYYKIRHYSLFMGNYGCIEGCSLVYVKK